MADLVTVVIPARNEERFIEGCLDAVSAQTYEPLEVIVVDGASTDRTADVVREYARHDHRVRLLHNAKAIVPVSLNLGVGAAHGRWMVRIDAHATVARDYVERCVRHLSTGEWGGVGGRVDPVGVTPAGCAIAAAMCSRFGIGNSVHHYGTEPAPADHVAFPGYPVDLVRELGGWDENLAVNQDFEFDYRIGQHGERLLYDPELVISYYGQQSIKGVWRQFRRYGRGKARVVLLHPASARLRHFVPPLLVLWLATAAVMAPWFPLVSLLAVAPYLGGLVAAAAGVARRARGLRAKAEVPVAFVAMHVAWGAGFVEGVARGLTRDQRRDRRRRQMTNPSPAMSAAHTTGMSQPAPRVATATSPVSAYRP